ncbi:MAG TPA: four helix bundle protein [Bacteroidota bacterium]|nr:four helix bundle protein [Bacteroidota bacterium]
MTSEDMKVRTKKFALSTIRVVRGLEKPEEVRVLTRQLLRAATSVGANYRSACLARSKSEFAARLQIALEEADESQYWIELLKEGGFFESEQAESVYREARELTAILMAGVKTARGVR